MFSWEGVEVAAFCSGWRFSGEHRCDAKCRTLKSTIEAQSLDSLDEDEDEACANSGELTILGPRYFTWASLFPVCYFYAQILKSKQKETYSYVAYLQPAEAPSLLLGEGGFTDPGAVGQPPT